MPFRRYCRGRKIFTEARQQRSSPNAPAPSLRKSDSDHQGLGEIVTGPDQHKTGNSYVPERIAMTPPEQKLNRADQSREGQTGADQSSAE